MIMVWDCQHRKLTPHRTCVCVCVCVSVCEHQDSSASGNARLNIDTGAVTQQNPSSSLPIPPPPGTGIQTPIVPGVQTTGCYFGVCGGGSVSCLEKCLFKRSGMPVCCSARKRCGGGGRGWWNGKRNGERWRARGGGLVKREEPRAE